MARPLSNELKGPQPSLILYCEGQTEEAYFKCFSGHVKDNSELFVEREGNISARLVKQVLGPANSESSSSGQSAIEEIVANMGGELQEEYKKLNPKARKNPKIRTAKFKPRRWFFFDHDARPQIEDAVKTLRQYPKDEVGFVCFNTCVETWFLFHFTPDPPPNDYSASPCEAQVKTLANEYISGYTKEQRVQEQKLPDLLARLEKALENLKSKEQLHKINFPDNYEKAPHNCTPSAFGMVRFIDDNIDLASLAAAYPRT